MGIERRAAQNRRHVLTAAVRFTCISDFQECSAEIVSEFTDCIAETTKLKESTAECYAFLTEAGLENQGDFRACVEEGDCEEECPAAPIWEPN